MYPEEDDLKLIREWDGAQGWHALMAFIKGIWNYAEWGWSEQHNEDGKLEYHISTAGWSGNEDIIAAMMENKLFWMMAWYQSRRGGHYIFRP